MITGEFWQLQDDAALRRIDEAAVRLLTKSGCRIVHEGLLALLESAGCRVQWNAMRCYFPEALIRRAVAHVGGHAAATVAIPAGWSPQRHLDHGGSFPHLLEWPSGERRLATRQDIIDMARLAHGMDEFAGLGRVLTCAEVDARIEPLWTTLMLAEQSNKPIGGGEIFHADYIAPLVRMGEVLHDRPGDTSLIAPCDFFIAPLILDRKQAECFLEKRKFGLVNMPGTMPISGISAPVTIAGTVAIATAELLAGWTIGFLVDPDLPVNGVVASGSLDLHTTAACFGSPEALLQDVTVVQLCRRLYNIHIGAAVNYVDCKRPGLEAVFQKMFALVGTPFGTSRFPGGEGLLSAGQDYCPVQHLLEADINSAIGRFWGSFEVNDATLALDLIETQMRGTGTNFLDTEHTLEHFRGEQWYPQWFDRSLWQGTATEVESEQKLLQRIAVRVRNTIRDYRRPEIDERKQTELRRIYTAAEQDILGKAVYG